MRDRWVCGGPHPRSRWPGSKIAVTVFAGLSMLAASVWAQEPPPPGGEGGDTYSEIQTMIDQLQGRVGQLGEPLPPDSLESLEKQVNEAINLLLSRQDENVLLRDKAVGLSTELDMIAGDREELNTELSRLTDERDRTVAELQAQIADLSETLNLTKEDLGAQLAAIRGEREDLQKELDAERERAEEMSRAAEEKEKEASGQLEEAEMALNEERRKFEASQEELQLLNVQLKDVRQKLAALTEALGESETKNKRQQKIIGDLGVRLNQALASKVEELARYRSEFFGRLRQALGDRRDLRIVGDRFVFQSEVLFNTGEATLEPDGEEQLRRLGGTLKEIATTIPDDIDWVLRVDGHTDRRPINTFQFPSNWELSTARATAVVKFLIEQGITANRLVAAGFGEFHPLDDRNDEIAFRRNRRIEFKLTQR